ncbi:MAG: TrkA family potassium uptake protein [Deltaproteobacteria bacterium]|nr:MAG: TrkA family potassium uptake protein [Deltaproteobacteria bacterium]
MGKFMVIGLGNFGYTVAAGLSKEGHEVVCIDRRKDVIQRIQPFVSYTIIGDASDKEILESLNVSSMDAVIISLGDNLSHSVLVTLHLKDLGAKNIIVKITNEDHGRVLSKVGATEEIFPEKDTALKLVKSLSHPNILDYLELSPEYSVAELAPPPSFVGKSLSEIELRKKYDVFVIAIKELVPEKMVMIPSGSFVIKDSDILVVIGEPNNIAKLKEE